MATVLAEEVKKDTKKDIRSLRSALEWLDSQGDVMTTDVEVDPDLELPAYRNIWMVARSCFSIM